MARRKPKELIFPFGGYDCSTSFQRQPPYTSSDLLNVLPADPQTRRDRGSSRCGLVPLTTAALESGVPIRLLASRPVVAYDGETAWEDDYDGTSFRYGWTAATWLHATLMPSLDGLGTAYVSSAATPRGLVFTPFGDIAPSVSVPYQIAILISPYQAQHAGTYYLFMRMDNTTPVVTTEGILLTITFNATSGAYSGTLKVYKGIAGADPVETQNLTGGTLTTRTGWLKANVYHSIGTAITKVIATWCGNTLVDYTTTATLTGTRCGWGAACTTASSRAQVGTFKFRYTNTPVEAHRQNRLVVSANGGIDEYDNGAFVQTVASGLSSIHSLHAGSAGQSLYIADYAHMRYSSTNSSIATVGGISGILDDTGVADWTALLDTAGLNLGNAGTASTTHRVEIIAPTAIAGTYAITNIHATNGLTLAHEIDGAPADAAAGTVTYKIARSLKVYNGTTLAAHVPTITNSDIPLGCPLTCFYRNRLVLAGPSNLWFMSRIGSYGDFDYSQTDVSTARYGGSTGSEIYDGITALIPFVDDYLIFACESSLWVLRGDISDGGTMDSLSKTVGVISGRAWCSGPSGEVYFLSRDGVYVLQPGGTQGAVPIGKSPKELLGVNPDVHEISMGYDDLTHGVHLYATPRTAATATPETNLHWWFSPTTGAFFPIRPPAMSQPTSLLRFDGLAPSEGGLLLGGHDGHVRHYRREAETDEGSVVSSRCFIGPVGDPYRDQRVVGIYGVLGENSGPVVWGVQVGNSAELALSTAALNDATTFQATGTWTSGRNYAARPRVRGTAFALSLINSSTGRNWTMEHIIVETETLGRYRKS